MTNSPIYYAACIPREERDQLPEFNAENFVSEEKSRILSIARRFNGARFKPFSDMEEALDFANRDANTLDTSLNGSLDMGQNDSNSSPSNTVAELPLPFPSIPVPKLSIFRRKIDADDVDSVRELIWSNPRYLINYTNDNPTIIMISGRYNAVHIAVRTGATNCLKYILKTIDSADFMALAYPNLGPEQLNEKQERMLDLYLNTPDKVANNSPMHFACSNGHIDCVRALLDYVPKCDIEYRNKFGKTCREVIKEGENHSKISGLFNDCMYVAIVRSNDDELTYSLPEPCFGKKAVYDTVQDRFGPKAHVSALAGPMSPKCARDLYRNIRSPKFSTPEHRDIRLKDPVRGLEKVVQKLTFEMDVDFAQYWSFLGELRSICDDDLLDRLEDELHKQHDELMLTSMFENLTISLNGFADQNGNADKESDKKDDEEEEEETYYSPPTSPILTNLIRVPKFFITSDRCEQIDRDVKSSLEIAIGNQSLLLEDLKLYHPFVYYWLMFCVA